MERQRLRYVLGYCVAMLIIAAIWIRMESVPDALLAMEQPEPSISTGQSEDGKVAPSYQALYPDMYVEIESQETSAKAADEEIRRFYLTFDDGPSEVTKEVVEALEKADARAAFFLIGNEITKEREDLLREMVEAGHILGIHTYSHDYKKIYGSVESYLEDFHQTYERIYEVTGKKPVYFRFPWGSINCYNKGIRQELIEEMERRGFQYFDWNVSAEDSVGKPSEYSVLHNVIDDFPKFKNAIVLMHDSNMNTISAKMLPQILQAAKEKGYEFGTIDELEKPYHWPNSY